MSAFGGEADMIKGVAKSPLLAKSGHSYEAIFHTQRKAGPEGPASLTGRCQRGAGVALGGENPLA